MSGLDGVRALRRKSHGDVQEAFKPCETMPCWPRSAQAHVRQHLRLPSRSRASSRTSRGSSKSSVASSRRASKYQAQEFLPPIQCDDVALAGDQPGTPDNGALVLSRQLHLDFHEVKFLLEELHKEQQKLGHDGMKLEDFYGCLLRILGVADIPKGLLQDAYLRCRAADGPIDKAQFLSWYRDHIFCLAHKPTFAGDTQKRADDLTLELAKKHHCCCIDMDKVKHQFDCYDLDRSGQIDYSEFEKMMLKLLHVLERSDLPQNRIQRFWCELDKDRNGYVDFTEFTEWYFKYFALAQETGPLEAFYASFGPTAQHSAALAPMCKTESESEWSKCSVLHRLSKYQDTAEDPWPRFAFQRRQTVG